MAKQTKTVLGQVIGLAVRHDALTQNPVREASPISTMPKNPPRAFTAPQAAQLMAALTYDDQAVARDLPALYATMLASGLRLGEACAVFWRSIDLERHARGGGNSRQDQGQGPASQDYENNSRPSNPSATELVCPDAAGTRRGRLHGRGRPFSDLNGELRDPWNTAADLRDAFEKAGFGWATSHVLRKTTASVLDAGRITAREIADQLGHARPSITMDRYMGRGVASNGAATVLETLA